MDYWKHILVYCIYTHSGSEVTAPSLNSGGLSIDLSLFIDTQLGSKDFTLCVWTSLKSLFIQAVLQ